MKRWCVVCGKELNIILGAWSDKLDGYKIISGGYYWKGLGIKQEPSKFSDIPSSIEEQSEYWECLECSDEAEE